MSDVNKRRIAIVDEFGELSDRIARLTPTLQRHRLLRDEIESWYRHEAPDKDYIVGGLRYEVQVGPREFRRNVKDMPLLFGVLGKIKFLSLCTFPLKALDEVTTMSDQVKLIAKERTGPRSIKSVTLDNHMEAEASLLAGKKKIARDAEIGENPS
jgi:hypothetical protein